MLTITICYVLDKCAFRPFRQFTLPSADALTLPEVEKVSMNFALDFILLTQVTAFGIFNESI